MSRYFSNMYIFCKEYLNDVYKNKDTRFFMPPPFTILIMQNCGNMDANRTLSIDNKIYQEWSTLGEQGGESWILKTAKVISTKLNWEIFFHFIELIFPYYSAIQLNDNFRSWPNEIWRIVRCVTPCYNIVYYLYIYDVCSVFYFDGYVRRTYAYVYVCLWVCMCWHPFSVNEFQMK